jgi:GrpB-like predicted nucleotidyltransferase (UPF0157 family)
MADWFDEAKGEAPALSDADPALADEAQRWAERLREALAPLAVRIEHIGSTAVPPWSRPPLHLSQPSQ